MRLLSIPMVVLGLLLIACQQEVVVGTPTTPPADGFVSEPDTPAPTSANTVDPVPTRDIAEDTTHRPQWLQARIQATLSHRKQYPVIRILRYQYRGQIVYWESSPCCDQFSTVYDTRGKVICQPDGGITGKGDGQCPDFNKNKSNEMLVWQDPR